MRAADSNPGVPPNPADESWLNINAMDDVARDILTIEDKIVVSALQGSAGAGGVILALFVYKLCAAVCAVTPFQVPIKERQTA